MNHYAVPRNSFAADEEMIGNSSSTAAAAVYRSETMVCPKPLRPGPLYSSLNEPSFVRPLRWPASHNQEVGNELLDIIILAKGEYGSGSGQAASSPPFFCGSPPSRASNPLIQDARFGDGMCHTPLNPTPSARKGGCNPTVRVEGFDCLDRDHGRSCSIPALA